MILRVQAALILFLIFNIIYIFCFPVFDLKIGTIFPSSQESNSSPFGLGPIVDEWVSGVACGAHHDQPISYKTREL